VTCLYKGADQNGLLGSLCFSLMDYSFYYLKTYAARPKQVILFLVLLSVPASYRSAIVCKKNEIILSDFSHKTSRYLFLDVMQV